MDYCEDPARSCECFSSICHIMLTRKFKQCLKKVQANYTGISVSKRDLFDQENFFRYLHNKPETPLQTTDFWLQKWQISTFWTIKLQKVLKTCIAVMGVVDTFNQKYSRLRCLLRVKGLVIGFYLGWSGHTLLIRKI